MGVIARGRVDGAAFGAEWLGVLEGLAIVSIGPQTSERCRRELGRVDAEASPHDLDGLLQACIEALGPRPLRAGL